MMRRSLVLILAAVLAALQTLTLGGERAAAVSQPAGRLVSDDPAGFTPHALDGSVYSVVQVGSTMVAGGSFSQVRNNNSNTVLTRNRLMAFDASTGAISTAFNPAPNGTVNVVLPAGDGTVYVGGSFTSIAGQSVRNLARIRVSDGSLVTTFNGGSPTGVVKDLALLNGRLWVAGTFTHIRGQARPALATLNAATGAFDTYFNRTIAGVHLDGSFTNVMKIDHGGGRLAAVGNFDTLDGVRNHQMLVLDVSGTSATPANFQTDFFTAACARAFDTYMRDVDFAPDGSFFVVSTTGAYRGYGTNIACDTASRFETTSTGTGIAPSWVDYTGGDTSYAVEVTDTAVYIGGHQRWWNNPYAGDRIGPGAVSRPGIAALNPLNGIPFSWNPTRDRGVGVFDLLNTSQGLWVASDTERIGAWEYHARIAMFPAAGKQVPAYTTAPFPNNVYAVAAQDGTPPLARRSFNGSTAGATSTVADGGITWANVRGAFMVNGELYLGTSDGLLSRRTFNGSAYGTPTPVAVHDQLAVLQNWRNDVAAATGMFYDSGRIYYTLNNSSTLYYRYINLESDIVGALQLVASPGVTGINFSQVRGMFLGGDKLYWATADGVLRSINWQHGAVSGAPVANTAQVVSGPGTDGVNWNSRALFLYQGANGQGAGLPPTAAFTSACTSLACSFDAAGSTAPGSSITSYAWNFGDGHTGTGAQASHAYTANGTYNVTLTITTAASETSTVTHPVTVTRVNQAPTADFSATCTLLECSFDAGDSADPDGTISAYAWNFGDGTTSTGGTAQHEYAAAGTYTVTLTVTDNDAATDQAQQSVQAREPSAASVAFVAAASTNGNRNNHTVQIPASAVEGDTLLLFLTINSTATITAPTGWTEVRATDGSGIAVRAWSKVATATDPGSTVAVALSAYAKGDLTVAAYRSSTGTLSVIDDAATSVNASSSGQSPALDLQGHALPVVYMGVKANSTLTATLSPSLTERSASTGSPSGAVHAWLADSGGYLTAGSFDPVTITLSGSANRVVVTALALQAQ